MTIIPGKNFIGQKGFPTPSDIPSDTACRSFVLPDNDEWLGLLMGAAEMLLNPHNYFNYGALSIDDTVDAWQLIIQDAYDRSLFGTCAPDVEAPYWDSAADVGLTEPVETQTWYGEIVSTPMLLVGDDLTFLDNLGIWAIAGFIAYSGQIGAAIAFVPLAKKFVLAFKQHSLGGVVSVLVDFLHLADIDTYGVEDGIIMTTVTMPDDEDSHTLYVMMSDEVNPAVVGEPNIQVVRKELSDTEVTPSNLRWNSGTNTVQQTPDGGTTWTDTPSADPRYAPGFQLPSRGGADPRCDATANMLAQLKKATNIFESELAQVQAANALLDIILVFLPEVGIVIEALLAATEFILTIGADVIAAAFTDAQWDIVKCILYCDIAADGTVDQTIFDKILDDMHTQNTTVVYDVLYTILTLGIGVVGLSNAGATGSETTDCSGCDCGWCYQEDLTVAAGIWTPHTGGGEVYAQWVSGTGFIPLYDVYTIIYSTSWVATYVDHVSIWSTAPLGRLRVNCPGGNSEDGSEFSTGVINDPTYTMDGSLYKYLVAIGLTVSGVDFFSDRSGGGQALVKSEIAGRGTIPVGFDNNCEF